MITVFHNSHFCDCAFLNERELEDKILNNLDYLTAVAKVDTTSLEEAYRLTNHLDHNWSTNKEVQTIYKSRSTSIGDVLSYDGTSYAVATMGFVEMCRTCPVSDMPCPEYKDTCNTYCHLK